MTKKCSYTRDEIISMCAEIVVCGEIDELYSQSFINYRSITKDTMQLCTEVVSEFLLDNIDCLQSIKTARRERRYRIPEHLKRGVPEGTSRKEEAIAISLLRESLDNGKVYPFGIVFDYQIPLKASQCDNYGKIDLVSESGDDIYLLELKRPDSRETMLRCVLESFTYSMQLDKEKFLKEYGKAEDTRIVAACLVFPGSKQHEDYLSEDQPCLKKLIETLSIPVFTLQEY